MYNKTKVYLAGGFKSDWGKRVEEECEGLYFINPKNKEYKNGERVVMDVNEYGVWDLHFIKQSDIVFVYLEKSNPSCIGLSVEAGYAKGIGKTVITVMEENDYVPERYLNFVTQVSDIVFKNLEEGINYLKTFKNV